MRKWIIHVILCMLVALLMTVCGFGATTLQFWAMLLLIALICVNATTD